jgi:hypothetical protein
MEKPAQNLLEPLKPHAQPLLEALKKNDVNELRALIRNGVQIQKWQLPSLLALSKESWVESMPVLMTECSIAENTEIQLADKCRVKSLTELAGNSVLKNKDLTFSCINKITNELFLSMVMQADQFDQFKTLGYLLRNVMGTLNINSSNISRALVANLTIPKAVELVLCMAEYIPAEQKQLLFGPVRKNIHIDWYTCLVSEFISTIVNRQVAIRNSYVDEFKAVNQGAAQIVNRIINEPDFTIKRHAFIPRINDSAYKAVIENSGTCYQFCLNNMLVKINK